jgi:hypothetical protein
MEAKVSKQNLPYFLALMNLQIRHSISGGNILLLLRLCFVLFHNHFLSAANRVMARRNNACHILLYYPLNSTPLSLSFPPTALLKDAPNFSLSGIVFGLPETLAARDSDNPGCAAWRLFLQLQVTHCDPA